MRKPKIQKRFCKHCKKHTKHKITLYKKGKERASAEGKRRYERKQKGYGSQSKPIQRNQAKINKKSTPIFQCTECSKKSIGKSYRVKRFELIEV